MGYKYQTITLSGYCVYSTGCNGGKTLTPKIQIWGSNDLSLGLPCSIYFRCSQVWYGAHQPCGLATTANRQTDRWLDGQTISNPLTVQTWYLYPRCVIARPFIAYHSFDLDSVFKVNMIIESFNIWNFWKWHKLSALALEDFRYECW